MNNMIKIRHARLDEKFKTYQWLSLSDTASMHMGKPDYPESPIPDWEQFQEDFKDFYFQEDSREIGSVMIITRDKEEIGCLCYACFHLQPGRAELDIWLNAKKYCGHGHGTRALEMLMEYLKNDMNINKFLIRPSKKNFPAIKSYQKAGFSKVDDKKSVISEYLLPEYLEEYGDGDYGFENTVVMVRE